LFHSVLNSAGETIHARRGQLSFRSQVQEDVDDIGCDVPHTCVAEVLENFRVEVLDLAAGLGAVGLSPAVRKLREGDGIERARRKVQAPLLMTGDITEVHPLSPGSGEGHVKRERASDRGEVRVAPHQTWALPDPWFLIAPGVRAHGAARSVGELGP
jgi:hypothetical protein